MIKNHAHTKSGKILTGLILEIFKLNGKFLESGDILTKPLGLTSARWQVVGAIEQHGQPMTVSQIARKMGLTRQNVQKIVNELEKLDWLELDDNPNHKRAKLVAIQSVRLETLAQLNASQTNWVNQLAQNLDEQALSSALDLLQKISIKELQS